MTRSRLRCRPRRRVMPALVDQRRPTLVQTISTAPLADDEKCAARGRAREVRAEVDAAWLECAYRHAIRTGGLRHGEHRKWQRPHDADAQWVNRVLHWAHATITGPWFLPPEAGELARVLLGMLTADCDVIVEVELRLIQFADNQDTLVALAVTDMPKGTDDKTVRLVGVVAPYRPAVFLPGQAITATVAEHPGGPGPEIEGRAR